MQSFSADSPDQAARRLQDILSAAQEVGVEVNAQETAQWLVAVCAAERAELTQDARSGIFGHHIALLDFDTDTLDYFRRVGQRVRAPKRDDLESALAISGSAAQGKVQLFPGDCDFFERLNIHAPSLDAARQTLREMMRETALRAFAEPDIVLVEANLGIYPRPVIERGSPRAPGDPITWTPEDVVNGYIRVETLDGEPLTIRWEDTTAGLGWTYLGWIVADRAAGRIALASNMLDVTWQAPDGTIMSFDGAIDPFFQEIYLEAAAFPVFTKIIKQVDSSAQSTYVNTMRSQVCHYTHQEPNYGKASKRLYNLFRLTDQLEAAAYVRELFDEPGARLYQVPGLLEAAQVALCDPRAEIDRDTILRQIEQVAEAVKDATEGKDEAQILGELARLRQDVVHETRDDWETILPQVRQRCAAIVNEFFRVRLFAFKQIQEFVDGLKEHG